jgi:3D (Asp-Asp-Asp) domain-containing protein
MKYGIKGHRQMNQAILFMTQYSQKLAYILLLGFILLNPHPAAAATLDLNAVFGFLVAKAAPAPKIANNTFPVSGPAEERYTTTRLVTAYNSTEEQCDDTPFITANGTYVHDGIVAANWLKFGTRVRIPEAFGDKVFIVVDRMHPRFDDRMDIWMADHSDAVKFGIQRLEVEVL